MWQYNIFILVLCLVHTVPVLSQWSCVQDSDCSDLRGAVCSNGSCGCPTGQQIGLAGEACINLAPYHTSECVEDHQCSRLFTMFSCSRNNTLDETGFCSCQPGHHYFLGRCWPAVDFGAACTRDEQCISVARDPYSLQCNGTCVCADGYYLRQRGECRKIGYAVGDGCVIDEDCQFTNGVCEINSRQCIDSTAAISPSAVSPDVSVNMTAVMSAASHGVACSVLSPCPEPLECSTFGACVCPLGYYLSDDGAQCNAELGSQSTPEQCVGLLAEVLDGVCRCPANFFYEENMRDCVKVTRRVGDSCVSDENCLTFGAAARCGPPHDLFELRTCECDPDLAVWEDARQMCRLFAGIGEQCEIDSDCLAGEFEIQCVAGTCACPAGLVAFEGLCLTTGLALGDACQATLECTETANTVCASGRCSCGDGYQEADDTCVATVGGSCILDDDCVIENTVCVNSSLAATRLASLSLASLARDSNQTCQCRDGFVAYDDFCWPVSAGYGASCSVAPQCWEAMGTSSECTDAACACLPGHHHRDGGCHPHTGLFESCTRTSQCFLESGSERTHCRNSVCQCTFDFPYSEELQTCLYSSSSAIFGSAPLIMIALTYLIITWK